MLKMFHINEIITGERIQQICQVYLGNKNCFNFNPVISQQFEKQVDIEKIFHNKHFNNPQVVFCYTNALEDLSKVINNFQNSFVLVSHNSDYNIVDNETTHRILSNNKLIKWYSQNVIYNHEKLYLLPIGIANSMWPHGNLFFFEYIYGLNIPKTQHIFMNFNIETNKKERQICYNAFVNKIPFLNTVHPLDNLVRLSSYKYCICPIGNGIDTHRVWECYYLKVVPITLNNTYSQKIKDMGLPILLLENWEELDLSNMPEYENFEFETGRKYLTLSFYENEFYSTFYNK